MRVRVLPRRPWPGAVIALLLLASACTGGEADEAPAATGGPAPAATAEAGGGTYTDARTSADLEDHFQEELSDFFALGGQISCVLLASGNSTGCEANRFLEVQSVIRRHIEEANAAGDQERAAAIGRVSEEATRRSGERSAEYQAIADEIQRPAQEAFSAVQQRMLERYGETVGYAVCPRAGLAGLAVS
jgi:hypothetical protein